MTDAGYAHLIEHERHLWQLWVTARTAAKAAESAWEIANDALARENLRRSSDALRIAVSARLDEALQADHRRTLEP